MPTLYNQYIYKDNEWKLVGLSKDTVTQSLLLSGNTLTLVGSDGSTSTATINTGELQNISVNGTVVTIVDGVADITVPTKTSDLTNDSGFITGQTETDPVFVASAAHGISSSDISNWNSKTSNTGTVTGVTAGTGLKIGTATSGGTISTSGTINHSNSVTAQTTQAVYPIKIDAQGHISAYGSAVTSMPASDVSSWAKATTKPTQTASEVGAITSSDASSMISNAIGVHDDETAVTYLLIVSNGTAQLKDSSMTNLIRIAALRQAYLLKHKIIIVQMISGTATRSYTIANVNMATSSTGTVDMFAADDDYVYYVQLTDSGSGLTGTYQEIPVGGTGTVTSVTAGAGLSGGTITASGTIAHSNSVTAQNTQAVYPIKIDAQGHISAYGTAVTSMPASDVSAWAKAASKPTYTASEVGALPSSTVIPTITDTYSGTSSDGMSGKAVKSAIDALDGTVTGTAGASKTLTAFSETNGVVSATFDNISITKSQVSDFPTIPEGLTDLTNDTSSSNKISSNLYIANSLYSDIAVFTGGKTSASDGAMGAELGRYGVLYLQGDSSYNPSIRFYGKTGSTTQTSYITETSDGSLTVSAPSGLNLQSLNYAPSSAETYCVPFSSATSAADGQYTSYVNGGFRYRTREGSESTNGLALLYLGNNVATGTQNNYMGGLMLYGSGTNYVLLQTATTMTNSPTIRFPDKGGTIALLSDIPTYNDADTTSY